jgi:D-lactate dehydrogenase
MKIAVFELEDWERQVFAEFSPEHEVLLSHETLNANNVHDYVDADILSVFIYSDLDAEVLEQFDNLKMIATRSTGYDHIDTEYCEEHGISVANVPTYGDTTVAEHVFGLLLAISHNLIEAADRTRRGDFSLQGLQGFDLRDKTLGVVGTGSIGRCVISIARGFGMRVIAFEVRPDEKAAQEMGFTYVDFDDLLANSDVITLHVPSNRHTRHIISRDALSKVKRGVVLINTARGPLVDSHALVDALANGTVRAAGLDVLPEEPSIREEAELLRSLYRQEHDLRSLLADHILLRMRNVIITPHSAFYTREAVERILQTTVENIRSFIESVSEPEGATAD